ncbi:MAG: hypothetical protein ACE5JO_12920 [Candidatus Binatia bacterium]
MREDLRTLASSVVDAYEMRVKAISPLMKKVAGLLSSFRREQEEMANELKDRLAKARSLRKKDFDHMMEEIRSRRNGREKEVVEVLERFQKEEEETIRGLRKVLTKDQHPRSEDFKVLKEEILSRHKERERVVTEMLRDFHLEQEELSNALRRLLSKGQDAKIKDLKLTITSLKVRRVHRQSEIGKILENLESVQDQVVNKWIKLIVPGTKSLGFNGIPE